MAIVGEEAAKIAIIALLPPFSRLNQPGLVTFGEGFCDDWRRHHIGEWSCPGSLSEVDEAIEQGRADQHFMLAAHMPAVVRPYPAPCLDLHRAKAITDLIGDDNVTIWDTCWRQSRDQPSPEELAHDEVLAGRTGQTGRTLSQTILPPNAAQHHAAAIRPMQISIALSSGSTLATRERAVRSNFAPSAARGMGLA